MMRQASWKTRKRCPGRKSERQGPGLSSLVSLEDTQVGVPPKTSVASFVELNGKMYPKS